LTGYAIFVIAIAQKLISIAAGVTGAQQRFVS